MSYWRKPRSKKNIDRRDWFFEDNNYIIYLTAEKTHLKDLNKYRKQYDEYQYYKNNYT